MNESKRQELPQGLWPGLWVVATPIGNLSDLSPRAREALTHASAVLCEDTRRTSKLMAAFGIRTRLERFDAHSGVDRLRELGERLAAGENFALVTDAGTPGISDPGAALVAEARAHGVRVVPVAGPSAVAALLSVSGFQGSSFAFRGFFPRTESERETEVQSALANEMIRIFVWFESPERITDSLAIISRFAPESRICAAKELTKLHEKVFEGGSAEVFTQVQQEILDEGKVGEWCYCADFSGAPVLVPTADWEKALACLIEAGVAASDAAKRISHAFGASKKLVYESALRISGKK